MGETVPVGYRFHPTDEELVDHYLKYKLLGDNSMVQSIAEVDVCKFEPCDLPAFSKVKSDDPEWFFFCPRNLKYSNSSRANRATNSGYWKVTGKERYVTKRGTDHVIGTKKTLVFYKGRVPHGHKTNWVIHEYQAVTFPVEKRTFVLCRLKLNPEKKADDRFDELNNEGERIDAGRNRIPDVFTLPGVTPEPIFSAPTRADEYDSDQVFTLPEVSLEQIFPTSPRVDENDLPSLQYSPIFTDQEQFLDSSIFTNMRFGNEDDVRQFPFDTTEDEGSVDSFLNSILVDQEIIIGKDGNDAFVQDSFTSQSLRQVYCESSETDIELVSAQYSNTFNNTSACKHVVSSGYQVMRMVDTPEDAVYSGTFSASPKTEVNQQKKDSSFGDNFWGVEISSNSTTKENVSSPSPPTASSSSTSRRSKTKSDSFISRKAAPRRSQTQRKLSSKAGPQHEVQKETQTLESNKDKRKAHDVRSRKNLETTRNESSSVNGKGKGSLIQLETPQSHKQNPRSAYLVNVIIGFSLLIVTTWDMLSFGKFG